MGDYKIFIVEDDPWYRELLQYHLRLNPDYKIFLFESGEECLLNMFQKPDLITLDFSLPDMKGDALFKRIKKVAPEVSVIMITAQEDIAIAVNLLKMGVTDYLIKDEATKDLLWNSIIRIRENQSLKNEVNELKEKLDEKYAFSNYIKGNSEVLNGVFDLMNKAVKTNINVSVFGETGTGKEMIAKAVHFNSSRRKRNFIAVNMAAIPSELIESELFGHEKGAFTGAVAKRLGHFENANGGTIFLDEIAELEMSLQTKLLRVLQERELVRVGGSKKIKLDVRLIVATHKNLAEEVRKGKFREDLYYRIMGLSIKLPSLRERGNDILILAKYFMDDFAKENKMGTISFSHNAKEKLMAYSFPGNVRELKAIVELAVVMCDNNKISSKDIIFNAIIKNEIFSMEQKTLREYTRNIIKYHLNKNGNDVIQTAQVLDIGKSTIYKMIKDGELN